MDFISRSLALEYTPSLVLEHTAYLWGSGTEQERQWVCQRSSVYVCVCVTERQRKVERGTERVKQIHEVYTACS